MQSAVPTCIFLLAANLAIVIPSYADSLSVTSSATASPMVETETPDSRIVDQEASTGLRPANEGTAGAVTAESSKREAPVATAMALSPTLPTEIDKATEKTRLAADKDHKSATLQSNVKHHTRNPFVALLKEEFHGPIHSVTTNNRSY